MANRCLFCGKVLDNEQKYCSVLHKSLDNISTKFNRSRNQTMFLYRLVDENIEKYIELEHKIKSNFIGYCPGDKEEVEKILSL